MRKKEDLGDFITIGAALILYAKGTAIEVEDGRFLIVQKKSDSIGVESRELYSSKKQPNQSISQNNFRRKYQKCQIKK